MKKHLFACGISLVAQSKFGMSWLWGNKKHYATWALICLGFILVVPSTRGNTGPVLMNEVMEAGIQAFTNGNFAEADRLFDRLQNEFGREPELREPETRKVLLPARAYAAFSMGNHDKAIEIFEEFLREFPDRDSRHAFCLYTLAQAYQLNEQSSEAASALTRFAEKYPDTPEAELAILQRADILFRSGEVEEALSLSDEFYDSDASATLRTQARLRALQTLVDEERFAEAGELLRNTQWRVTAMPELAVLTFAAMQTGDAALAAENYPLAVFCYQLVPPYEELLLRQRKQLELAERVLQFRRDTDQSSMATVWNNYYAQLVDRLQSQLESLENMEDYMPAFQLRRATAFLKAGRGYEAWILFQTLSEDETIASDIRQQAHYLWVLAAYSLDEWEEALRINRVFHDRYPDSELAPNATYLIAQAYQERGEWKRSTEILTDLMARFPEHELAPRWRYTRGYNLTLAENYEGARDDFSFFLEEYPGHPLAAQTALWYALTYSFERDYQTALSELEALRETWQGHPLYPEIYYRIATMHYAMRDYPVAMQKIDSYLEKFSMHARAPEATVLRGDILMGKGRLLDAAAAFASVSPEAGGLFPYAVFQRGKIFQALERYDLMERHFREYLAREDLPVNARVSEALYWLGWALIRQDNPEAALDAYDQALERYGNDTKATEVNAILASLEAVRTELLRTDSDGTPSHPLLEAENFEEWLLSEQKRARQQNRATWLSRLKYHEVVKARGRGNDQLAQTLLMEIDEEVDMSDMDPMVVGEIGLVYADFPYKYAGDYFDHIMEHHPRHPARANAWFGGARLAFEEGRLDYAHQLLERFERELPAHPLAPRVKILQGRIHTYHGRYDEAEKLLEEVLQLREARGILHAQALAGLAEMNENKGNLERAIPYWQRIYTLYRAYPDLVAEAYYKSALLFDEIGSTEAAYNSLEEMLSQDRLLTTPYAERATRKLREIRERIREENSSSGNDLSQTAINENRQG